MKREKKETILGVLRILMGWIFLWPFLDKVFGLGFSTPAERSWLSGSSPTEGFLLHGTAGPFGDMFASLAGMVWVDWAYMLGLLLVGIALFLGVASRLATIGGVALLVLITLASAIPPEHNPLIDEHVIYIVILLLLRHADAGRHFGLGEWWTKQTFVKKNPMLQ